MEKAKKYEEESMVADMLASKVKTTDQANNDFPKFSIPIGIDMNKDKEDVGSDHAVQDGGYMNVESTSFDNGDSKGMSNILGQLQDDLANDHSSDDNTNNLYKSQKITGKQEDRKKTLLQYKIVDRDSDCDVIEGLGNTTIKDDRADISDGSDQEATDGVPFGRDYKSPPRLIKKDSVVAKSTALQRLPSK